MFLWLNNDWNLPDKYDGTPEYRGEVESSVGITFRGSSIAKVTDYTPIVLFPFVGVCGSNGYNGRINETEVCSQVVRIRNLAMSLCLDCRDLNSKIEQSLTKHNLLVSHPNGLILLYMDGITKPMGFSIIIRACLIQLVRYVCISYPGAFVLLALMRWSWNEDPCSRNVRASVFLSRGLYYYHTSGSWSLQVGILCT